MPRLSLRRLRRLLSLSLLLIACAAALAGLGCSDSSGPAAVAGTGTVSLFVTDAASDAFDEINVTVREVVLIGGGPQVTIFEGSETFDLKSLEQFSDLFLVAEDVPARTYSKIRLRVSAIELVDYDGDPEVIPVDPPANGKIDLNPRGSFEVKPGGHLVIELDMDAEKSIHLHETGNGEYRFRPVVFVHIEEGVAPKRPARLHGYVSWRLDDRFRLCPLPEVQRAPMASVVGGGRRFVQSATTDSSSGRPRSYYERCVVVELDERTGVFDANGDPVDFDALGPFPGLGIPTTPTGRIGPDAPYYVAPPDRPELTVIGHFDMEELTAIDPSSAYRLEYWSASASGDGEDDRPLELFLRAAVIEEGPIGTFLQLAGWLEPAHDVDPADVLRFLPAPGQGFGDSTWLPALLQEGTRFFDDAGEELFADELGEIVSAEIDGVFGALDDSGKLFYKTALVMVGDATGPPQSGNIEGVVSRVDLEARTIELAASPFGLDVPDGLEIQFVYEVGDAVANAFAPLDALAPGTEISIAAEASSGGLPPVTVTSIVAYGAPSLWPPCLGGDDCAVGTYCRRPDDHCDWGGVCEPIPQACTDQVDPVCGCDGVVYSNACEAAATGASLQPNREVCSPAS